MHKLGFKHCSLLSGLRLTSFTMFELNIDSRSFSPRAAVSLLEPGRYGVIHGVTGDVTGSLDGAIGDVLVHVTER